MLKNYPARGALTVTVVFGVCANVLEDEGSCGGNDQDFEHEIVQSLPENPAEAVSL